MKNIPVLEGSIEEKTISFMHQLYKIYSLVPKYSEITINVFST